MMRDTLLNNGVDRWPAVVLAGLTSGFLNWLPGIPFDIIKTNMQTSLSPRSIKSVAMEGYSREGLGYFWKGGHLLLLRGTPSAAITFVVYE